MTKEKLWEMFCNARPLQRQAACETLLGCEGRPQYPLTEDVAIVWNSEPPYVDMVLAKRLHTVAMAVKPSYLPDMDLTIIASAGYQLGLVDGKREERARKKGHRVTIGTRHDDLNNTATKGRSVSL